MSLWKRGFLEIVAEILSSLMNNPLKKIGIIAKCKLDSRACTKYLSQMQSIDLIKTENNATVFVITQKGIDFLKQYEKLIKIIEDDLQRLNTKS